MENIGKLNKDICYGCFINHPSQTQHTCLIDTIEDKINTVFDEALDNVYIPALIDRWMSYLAHTDFSTCVHPVHLIKYWLETTYTTDACINIIVVK